jgi:hypothetical protein
LVAGCGAAARIGFAAHSRPASPLEISVLMGRSGSSSFDPDATRSSIRPGPVIFDISNQSRYDVRFSVRQHGRTLARTPVIAPGLAAQLKTALTGDGITFNAHGSAVRSTLTTSQDLRVVGRLRTGNNEVTQP